MIKFFSSLLQQRLLYANKHLIIYLFTELTKFAATDGAPVFFYDVDGLTRHAAAEDKFMRKAIWMINA
ncbi:MAG: hypothetical protein DRR19_24830 [Candidatus Parabeggiatoa sp. nov. 1]|nr:MAG: hypothetical protein DRR19_24830 [Gammaproteobacteria bacterium]